METFLVLKSSSQRNLLGYVIGYMVFVAICLQLGYFVNIRDTMSKYRRPTISANNTAVVCSIQKQEDAYIDEWVDYHLAIGFKMIYIYDNTDNYDLRNWGNQRFSDNVRVKHFPGIKKQVLADIDCAKRAEKDGATWAAFFDTDEFLLLKKNKNINEFLVEYGPSKGAIGINWMVVGTSNATKYEPKPVTLRFQHTYNFSPLIKTIARVKDLEKFENPHQATFIDKTAKTIDTNGSPIKGPRHKNMTTDVAVLYHYQFKSREEFIARKEKGRPDMDFRIANHQNTIKQNIEFAKYGQLPAGDTFDDSIWRILKNRVPRYGLLEDIGIISKLSIYLRMFMQNF